MTGTTIPYADSHSGSSKILRICMNVQECKAIYKKELASRMCMGCDA